jgi:DNA-binding NarL/FixJ family response regulator
MRRQKRENQARVLIVDDDAHQAVREALIRRIGRQPDLRLCGEAADMSRALRLIADTKPDVAIVDISLTTGNGVELIRRLKERDDRMRILVWSMQSESLYAEPALRAGALGYITKDQTTARVVEAIRRVLTGKVWLSEALISRSPMSALADREAFRLLDAAVKIAEMAERMRPNA